MVARAIHQISGRLDKPSSRSTAHHYRPAARSELFGHEKGAFTGAHRRKPGKFELAPPGHLPPRRDRRDATSLQAKLAPRSPGRKFFSVGGTELITRDVRLIAATIATWAP